MSDRNKGKPLSKSLGLECGLTIPKFLQPYQDMLGKDSVFRASIHSEREDGFVTPMIEHEYVRQILQYNYIGRKGGEGRI